MRSSVAVTSLCLICLFGTLPIYYFDIPDTLKVKDVEGMWSPVTSDFNWCEHDYVYSPYVVEFWNTVTSLTAMLFAPIIFWFTHMKVISTIPRWAQTQLLLQVLCGIMISLGSAAFHGTLWYELQLWDEFGIYSLVIVCGSTSGSTIFKTPIRIVGSLVIISILLTLDDRHGLVHQFLRGFMSCSFVLLGAMITFFNFETMKSAKKSAGKSFGDISLVVDWSFILFVCGTITWILENWFCSVLPGWLQLHAFGWHMGAAVVLYCIPFMSLVAHVLPPPCGGEYKEDTKASAIRIRWCAYVIPVLELSSVMKDN